MSRSYLCTSPRYALTGGGAGALDQASFYSSQTTDGDVAIVFLASETVFFKWDEDSGLAEDGTTVIKPDGYSGDGRWIKTSATSVEVLNHSELNELDYASSGHTGFTSTVELTTTSGYLQDQIDDWEQYDPTTLSGYLQDQIDSKSDTGHTHDDRYYTESEVDILIAAASGTTNHSDLNELDYASAGHTGFASSSSQTTLSGYLQDQIDDNAGNIVTTHSGLTDLDANDHPQYVLHTHTVGTDNFVAGPGAGTTLDDATADDAVIIGHDAGYNNFTADNSVIIGYEASYLASSVSSTVVVGHRAGYRNIYPSVFIGSHAGYNITGEENVAIGIGAMGYTFTVGDMAAAYNTVIGHSAGNSIGYTGIGSDTSSYNTLIGRSAGYSLNGGNNNTFVGNNAGGDTSAGDNNVFINNESGRDLGTGDHRLVIASERYNDAYPLIYGIFQGHSLYDSFIGINTVTYKEMLTVAGAIHIGTTANTNAGAIRYTGSDFEGYHDGEWLSLTTTSGVTSEGVERFTLDAGDITNKYVTLAQTPSDTTKVIVHVINGLAGELSIDYTITDNKVTWSGLQYETDLEATDKLLVAYQY